MPKDTLSVPYIIVSLLFCLWEFYKHSILKLQLTNRFVDYFDSFTLTSTTFKDIISHCNYYKELAMIVSLFKENELMLLVSELIQIDDLIPYLLSYLIDTPCQNLEAYRILIQRLRSMNSMDANKVIPPLVKLLDKFFIVPNDISFLSILLLTNYCQTLDSHIPNTSTLGALKFLERMLQTESASSQAVNSLLQIIHEISRIHSYPHDEMEINSIDLIEIQNKAPECDNLDVNLEPILTKSFNQLTEKSVDIFIKEVHEYAKKYPSKVLKKIIDEAVRNKGQSALFQFILHRMYPLAYIKGNDNISLLASLFSRKLDEDMSQNMVDNYVEFLRLCLLIQETSAAQIPFLIDPCEYYEYCIYPKLVISHERTSLILDLLEVILNSTHEYWIMCVDYKSLLACLCSLYLDFDRYPMSRNLFSQKTLDVIVSQIKLICRSLRHFLTQHEKDVIVSSTTSLPLKLLLLYSLHELNDDSILKAIDNTFMAQLYQGTVHSLKPLELMQYIESCCLVENIIFLEQLVLINNISKHLHLCLHYMLLTLSKREFSYVLNHLVPTLISYNLLSTMDDSINEISDNCIQFQAVHFINTLLKENISKITDPSNEWIKNLANLLSSYSTSFKSVSDIPLAIFIVQSVINLVLTFNSCNLTSYLEPLFILILDLLETITQSKEDVISSKKQILLAIETQLSTILASDSFAAHRTYIETIHHGIQKINQHVT